MTEYDSAIELVGGTLAATNGVGDALAQLAAAVKDEHERPNTDRAYRGDWTTWLLFCDWAQFKGLNVLPLSVSSDVLVVYARWLGSEVVLPDGTPRNSSSPETMRRRITGVLYGWSSRGVDYPRKISAEARRWINAHEAELIATARQRPGRGKAPALRMKDLRQIVKALPDDPRGHRDRAIVLLGFSIAARRSELSVLDVEDIAEHEFGVEVDVRKSKTGFRTVPVIFGQTEATCPVRAWNRWRNIAGLTEGPAFRHIDRHGRILGRLSPAAIGEIVTASGALVDVAITGHSLRAGLATEARKAGHTPEQIADQGGWKRGSTALQGYIRNVDQWSDNVLAGIGL